MQLKDNKSALQAAISAAESQTTHRLTRGSFLARLHERLQAGLAGGLPEHAAVQARKGKTAPSDINSRSPDLSTLDDDLVVESVNQSETSSSELESASDSDSDASEEAQEEAQQEEDLEENADTKLEQEDRLLDLAYEEKLWVMLGEGQVCTKAGSEELDSRDLRSGESGTTDGDSDSIEALAPNRFPDALLTDSRAQSEAIDDEQQERVTASFSAPQASEVDEIKQDQYQLDLHDDGGDDSDDGAQPAAAGLFVNVADNVRARGVYAKTASAYRTKEFISLSDEEKL